MSRKINRQDIIKENYLFQKLNDSQIEIVLSIANEVVVPKNTYIIQEGEEGNDIYLLLNGKVAIRKKDQESGKLQQIGLLGPGEIIGEIPLIDNQLRSASVCTLEETRFLVLPLARLFSEHPEIYSQIKHNIAAELARKFRKTDELTASITQKELEGARIRIEMGRFLLFSFTVLSLWVFFVSFFEKQLLQVKYSSYISVPIIVLLLILSFVHAKQSIYPWSFFGVTSKNWKKNAVEGIFFQSRFLL